MAEDKMAEDQEAQKSLTSHEDVMRAQTPEVYRNVPTFGLSAAERAAERMRSPNLVEDEEQDEEGEQENGGEE